MAPARPDVKQLLFFCGALGGAALIALGGRLYRIDRIRCQSWPDLRVGLEYAPLYLAGLGLLTLAWLGVAGLLGPRSAPRDGGAAGPSLGLRDLFVAAVAVHLVAAVGLPFLSDDTLAYSAIGRAMAVYHAGAYVPLGEALPPGDPFRQAISQYDAWLRSGSAYGVGFNQLARSVALLGGDNVTLNLRLYQLLGLALTLATAAVAARVAREAALAEAPERAERRAAALVLFCPLTIVEATVNGHNDALLMLSVALFSLAAVRRRTGWALAALGAGILVKASAVLLLAFYGLHLGFRRAPARHRDLRPRQAALLGAACGLLVVGLVLALMPLLRRYAYSAASLLGSTADAFPYCTRSVECLPRALLHIVLGQRFAAWTVGLAFRGAAVAFLVYSAARSRPGPLLLRDAAFFLLIYYLYLHAFSQAWYLLSLLPLVPVAEARLRPAMLCALIANLAQYAPEFAYNCDYRPVAVGVTEVVEALVVLVPPSLLLLRRRGLQTALPGAPP